MGAEKEELFLKKRILELAERTHRTGRFGCSAFLNLYEQTIVHSCAGSFPPVSFRLTGGYEAAERKVVCFLPSYETEIPDDLFSYIRIEPVQDKFAQDLTHRDFLGAFMNLGLERRTIGDICVSENRGHLILLSGVREVVLEGMKEVSRTRVRAVLETARELGRVSEPRSICVNISASRLDAVIAAVYRLSRNPAKSLIEGEKVFINGRSILQPSRELQEEDLVSVRGLGRFRFLGLVKSTKKGRWMANIAVYR